MSLTRELEELYKKTMEEAKKQLDTIDEEMEKEIQKTRTILAQIQESKRAFQHIYEGIAELLGIEVETNEEKDDELAAKEKGDEAKNKEEND